tara:strand:+ start:373 stop:882 length:510 start_codon:yes stop_codon:yes gene_type:complete
MSVIMSRGIQIISVIGGREPTPEEEGLALEVGRELAINKIIVACGGLGGVMEAACKGAKEKGGTTIGILPGSSAKEANNFVDIPIITGIGFARNMVVVKTGQAVIAVGGSFGTLSEIGHALSADIPVIGLSTWDLPDRGEENRRIIKAASPKHAVELAMEQIKLKSVVE